VKTVIELSGRRGQIARGSECRPGDKMTPEQTRTIRKMAILFGRTYPSDPNYGDSFFLSAENATVSPVFETEMEDVVMLQIGIHLNDSCVVMNVAPNASQMCVVLSVVVSASGYHSMMLMRLF